MNKLDYKISKLKIKKKKFMALNKYTNFIKDK